MLATRASVLVDNLASRPARPEERILTLLVFSEAGILDQCCASLGRDSRGASGEQCFRLLLSNAL